MGIWWRQSRNDEATHIVERIGAAFDARDFAALRLLFTKDACLVDSMCDKVAGRDAVLLLVERLIAYDPEFRLHVDEVTTHQGSILVTGYTTGARQCSAQRTLWKLSMRDGQVAEWRSFSADDPKPLVRLLMGERKPALA